MKTTSFARFAGLCAILAGIIGFLYSVAFVVLQNNLLSALFLLLGGLLTTVVMTALYERLREADAGFALWAFTLALVSAAGAAIHGTYDLANAINPPPSIPDLPSAIDARGFLTFGVAGLALFIIAWLIGRGGSLPGGLATLGYLLAVLLVIIYLGRLIILAPTNPLLLVPAALTGFIVNPLWYIWLGLSLQRGQRR
jgi:hypothetical protein